jgi:hypothetical protein
MRSHGKQGVGEVGNMHKLPTMGFAASGNFPYLAIFEINQGGGLCVGGAGVIEWDGNPVLAFRVEDDPPRIECRHQYGRMSLDLIRSERHYGGYCFYVPCPVCNRNVSKLWLRKERWACCKCQRLRAAKSPGTIRNSLKKIARELAERPKT